MSDSLARLLADGPIVIALGAGIFADALREQGAVVEELAWRPPALVDAATAKILEKLL